MKKRKILHCQFASEDGSICGAEMDVPQTSCRKYCDQHQAAQKKKWEAKYQESGTRRRVSESRIRTRRRLSLSWPERRAAIKAQYGVQGGSGASHWQGVIRAVKF